MVGLSRLWRPDGARSVLRLFGLGPFRVLTTWRPGLFGTGADTGRFVTSSHVCRSRRRAGTVYKRGSNGPGPGGCSARRRGQGRHRQEARSASEGSVGPGLRWRFSCRHRRGAGGTAFHEELRAQGPACARLPGLESSPSAGPGGWPAKPSSSTTRSARLSAEVSLSPPGDCHCSVAPAHPHEVGVVDGTVPRCRRAPRDLDLDRPRLRRPRRSGSVHKLMELLGSSRRFLPPVKSGPSGAKSPPSAVMSW